MFINAIDTHCHLNYGPKDSLVHNHLTDIMQEGDLYTAYWDVLSKISETAHIGKVFVSPFDGVLDTSRTEASNEFMFDLANKVDALYQWVIIDPRNENTFTQAERMLKFEKCVGIKIHPVCHKNSVEEYGDKIFSFADKLSAIVQIHPEKGADYILPFANQYQNATFIMAHLKNEYHIKAVRDAKFENVYVDTSGFASLKNRIIEYAVSQIGSEHILFGTDTYSAASQRGRIEFAMLGQRDKENILLNNAKRLFNI